jgi:hypothetical protein
MFRSFLFTAVVLGSVLVALPASGVAQQDAKRAERTAKVKAGIQKIGSGSKAVVKIRLYDKTEYRGNISRVGDQDFEITTGVGQTHVVNFSDVKSVGGKNLSTGAKIGIGIGIGAGATILTLLLIFASLND